MQTQKKRKSIKYSIISIALLLCITIAIMSGAQSFDSVGSIPTTPMADATLNSNYSAFEDGSTYLYTDLSKVEVAHNDPTKSDTSTIVVDREQSHGSLQNPYVINTLTQWNYFAANTGSADVDKVFVLGSDITFTSGNFTPVANFYGKFYGGGHTLYNATYNFGSNNDCGIFRVLQANGIISDVNLDNVNITSTGGSVGTLVGTTYGGDILNCHVKGIVIGKAAYIEPSSGQITQAYPVGGLVGGVNGNGIKVYIYRCSADVKMTVTTNKNGTPVGGILGGITGTDGSTATSIYDCLAIVDVTSNTAGLDIWFGGIVTYSAFVGEQVIENCVSYVNATDNAVNRISWGSLFNSWAWSMSKLTVKNVYSDGKLNLKSNASEYSLPAGIYYTGEPALTAIKNVSLTSNNLNWFADKTFFVGSSHQTVDVYDYRSLTNTKYTGAAGLTQADMYDKAQSDLPSNIWVQKSNITSAYMSNTDVTSTAGYTVQNAPNRNTSIKTGGFTIKYVNLENSAEKEYEGNATTYNYKDTTQLYTPTAQDNHVFVGWTLDKTGNGAIYKNIPIDLYGDVTMYAVWDVPQASIAKESIISAESNGAFTKEYSQGSSLTMRGDISITSMTSPVIQYMWHKNGDTTILGTSSTYSISNVAETGDYVLDYVITDSVEPLWRHSGSTTAQHAEITPGQLFIKDNSFVIDSTTPEYMGKRLRDIKFSITMIDSMGREVEGVASWQTGINQVQEGTNKENITFAPTNTNYTSTGEYEVEFEAKYITLTFNMPDVSDTIVANMMYQQTYTTNNIIQSFYTEYTDRLENNPRYAPLKNMTPMFDKVKITEFTGQYVNVQSSEKIEVTFVDATYTVTFDPDNGEATFTNTTPIYYNNRVIAPTVPVNGDKVFLGWYFDDITVDSNGLTVTTNRAWNFDSDFVTKDLTLTAKWLDAVLDLVKLEVKAEKDSYTATEQIKAGDLKVTAYYQGDVEGYGTVDQDAVLSFGQYDIEYENKVDNALHVGQGNITVSYTYKGHTETVTINLPVVAKKIDTSGLTFNDKTVTYTGDAVAIDKIRGMLPDEIVNVKYVYTKNGVEVDEADVKDIGTYIVQAIFEMDSIDFVADPLRATLQIRRAGEILTAVWENTSFVYNGEAQHPSVKFIDGDGLEVNDLAFHFEGDENVKNVGNNYNIKVVLDESAYQLDTASASCDFSIVKAVLDAPTLKDDMTIVYDGSEKKFEDFFNIDTNLIEIASGGVGTDAGNYTAILSLKDTTNCEWSSTSGATGNTVQIKWTIDKAHLTAVWNSDEHVSDGNEFTPSVVDFVGIASVDRNAVSYENDVTYEGDMGKSEVGAYSIKAILNASATWAKNYILDGGIEWAYVIIPQEGMQVITIEWVDTELVFNGKVQMPTYIVWDKDGNDITEQVKGMLTFGGDYDKSKWADDYQLTVNQPSSTYFIKSGLVCNYSISIDENGNGYNPNPDEDGEDKDGGLSFDNVGEMLKQWWQVIVSAVSIILIIAFLSKAASYEGRRKKANKTADERYKSYYAGATGLFGLAMTSWTVIACVLMGLAVASLVIMLIAKSRCSKAEDNLAYSKEEFERNKAESEARQRDENMRMMFMSMMGGQGGNMGQGMAQGGYAYAQPGIGVEEMRGLISETVTALLPGMQQMLPQQASTNDEVIKQIMKTQEDLAHNQELLMKKMAEQPAERIVEKEVVAGNANDETIQKLMERSEKNDERIAALMEKMIELSANQNAQPQVVEKVIEKEVPVEKIVEKIVEVPVEVEKIVEKEVPVEVEKIVEKEVKVEVPVEVEKIVEKEVVKEVPVEKIVEKEVRVEIPVEKIVEVPVEKVVEKVAEKEVKVTAPAKPKAEKAPRLTLDEAYALLSKEQKKYFDGLRDYALTKYKCKEKKSTYFVVYGQTSTNPLVKLTIKKDTTVALLKMEDEYMKDIRRDATGDGTKVRVKETEVVVSDAQAYATAKKMVDLRDDQIERYQDLLREQRAMNKKK